MESKLKENIKVIPGGVTAAKGFEAAAAAAEIKYKGRTDMALIYSQTPCQTAGTFTSNIVKAAPVKWDQKIVAESPCAQAVVVNSGIANACTGAEGYGYCQETAAECAKVLGIPEDAVLVASTGVIGMQLPIDRLKKGITLLKEAKGSTIDHGTAAAKAIMTTDACISKEMLQRAVSEDVKDTFNMISVDGDTSTNDTLLVLANAAAENPRITEENEDYRKFAAALNTVNTCLAKKMAGDGEGATALFEVKIVGAKTKADAVTLSKSVVTSSLVKAAIYGHDANWGRILCAMGYSGVEFNPERVDLFFESPAGRLQIIENGVAVDYSEEEASRILSQPEVTALADVKMGEAEATAWGCDLTYDYVKINADYRS